MTRPNLSPELIDQLRWPLRLTKVAIGLERGWHAFWPLATVMMFAVAWSRFIGVSPISFSAFAIAALGTLVWGLYRFRLPTGRAAEARLDQSLPHAPFSALRDLPAFGDEQPASAALWHAHLSRMEAEARTARPPVPDLRVAGRDPFALRLMAAVAFVMALGFTSGPVAIGSSPPAANTACPDCPVSASWEGWIEPPAYTGLPSLYLNDQPSGPLLVPKGSTLTLRFYGLDNGSISLGGDLLDDTTTENMQIEITRNSGLSIDVAGQDTGHNWRITAMGDIPPEIRPNGDLTREVSGSFQQAFLALDDYGIAAGVARIELELGRVDRSYGLTHAPDPRAPVLVDLPRPYRGDLREVAEVWEENLAQHPWAGLPVAVTLIATDDAGQEASASPLHFPLPARRFFTPEGRALIELRRDLLWARAGAPRVARILRAVLHRPDALALPDGSYLALRAVIRDLEAAIATGLDQEAQDRIAGSLWEIALSIEDRGLDSAKDRLARAQERLEQAMRDGASPEELAELMEELRRATDDYLNRLAQMPQDQDPAQPGSDGEQMEMSSADLDALMDQIEELMREGRMDEAMQMLNALRQMMQNMQVRQGDGNGETQQARKGLTDTLREQQGLSDEAFRDLQEQGGQTNQAGEAQNNTGRDGGQGRGQSHSGNNGSRGEGAPEEEQGQTGAGTSEPGDGLANRQRQLRQQLDAQRRGLPGAGSEAGNAARDALGQAGRAMDQAADALEKGDLAGALDRQAEAMEALREGLRRFDEATATQQAGREGQQGQTEQERGNQNARDPLGRATGSQAGRGASDGGFVSEEDMRRRAQELTDELRKRSGETNRPQEERDYIERLLEQF